MVNEHVFRLRPPFPISQIFIPATGTEKYTAKSLDNLSGVNVFIGVNNSGKSRLLRKLFSEDRFRFLPGAVNAVNEFIRECTVIVEKLSKYGLQNMPAVNEARGALKPIETIIEGPDFLGPCRLFLEALSNAKSPRSDATADLAEYTQQLNAKFEVLTPNCVTPTNFFRVYIPSIRGLRAIGGRADIFRDHTRKDYFEDKNTFAPQRTRFQISQEQKFDIFTGLETYDLVQRSLLGNLQERESIREFERFISSEFFDSQEVTIIPRIEDVLHIRIGREEYPIHDLGDGIQQIIILTLPVFLFRDRQLLLFIEEPELFLHPGLQRQLVDALIRTPAAARQVFLATHSNQFLDLTLDESEVTIHKFRKEFSDDVEGKPVFRIEPVSNGDFHFLRELGVSNSSVMLSNCTIWVEGITDRLYIRKFLEVAQTAGAFAEDIHYSFVEYGGSCITHWSFLDRDVGINVDRLCGRLLLIADLDEKKESRHAKLREFLGDRFYLLPRREIENLLKPETIRAVIKSYEGEDVMLNDFAYDDYGQARLGTFIDRSVLKNVDESTRKRSGSTGAYCTQDGTLKDKLGFAERALATLSTVDVLSPEAVALAERVAEFIKSNNPKLYTKKPNP